MKSFKQDFKYGIENEKRIFDLLQNKYDNLKHSTDKYSKFDFYNDKYEFELKTRNNNYNAYPTTLIACDKVQRKTDKKIILLFDFTDGLYYIKYKPRKFNKFSIIDFQRFQRKDFNDIKKQYYHIPINKLKKLILP
ncbi:MAG: hypothetical protein GY737_30040 [Desulfobacteraceae bacterium]|nr:hypothetical protein [Desulfobacteraceae bacterium]